MALPDQAQFETNLFRPNDETPFSAGWLAPGAPAWAYGAAFLGWVGWPTFTPNPANSGELLDSEWYYDATRTYYGIADYTSDAQWIAIAEDAMVKSYLPYLEDPGISPRLNFPRPETNIKAELVFPWGLYATSTRHPDGLVRARALHGLYALAAAKNFGYFTPLSFYGSDAPSPPNVSTAREVGYNLQAKYLALRAGYLNLGVGNAWYLDPGQYDESPTLTLPMLALAYCDQWIQLLSGQAATNTNPVTAGFRVGNPIDAKYQYTRPFMVCNVVEGLQLYVEASGDTSIIQKIVTLLDLMWSVCFRPSGITMSLFLPDGSPAPRGGFVYGVNGMLYTDRQHAGDDSALGEQPIPNDQWVFDAGGNVWQPPARSAIRSEPVLNGLIIPSYWWMFNATGDTRWRDRCDLLFDGLVRCTTPFVNWDNDTQVRYNSGKTFNQVYSRIWPYVAASVSGPPPPPTAFTSAKSGVWTDPATWGVASGFPTTGTTATIAATHTVTLNMNAVVGKSQSINTEANVTPSMLVKGTLDLNGFTFTCQGSLTCYNGDTGRLAITGSAGSIIILDSSVNGIRYWLSPGGNIVQLTGTAAAPCQIRSNSASNTSNLYTGETTSRFVLTQTILTDLSDVDGRLLSKQPASSNRGAGTHVLDHCHVVRCGAWGQGEGTLTATNSTWVSTLGGAAIDYQANTSSDPILRNNVFDQNVLTTSKGHYTGNIFLGNFLTWIDYGNVDESSDNFIRATGTNCIAPQGTHSDTILLYDGDDVNPHICPNTINLTATGWVMGSTGLDNNGDGFIGPRGTNVITRSIFLTNAADIGFVTYVNLINNVVGATVAFSKNTCIGCSSGNWGIVSEGGDPGHTGLLALVKDNLFYGTVTPAAALAILFLGGLSAVDVGLASNIDYNDKYLLQNGTVYDQNGLNPKVVNGYDQMRFTGGAVPGVHDQTADPLFTERRHVAFYDQAIFGLHPSVWAPNQSYVVGQQVQSATPTYWQNRAANFTCLAATAGVMDSVAQPMLGSNWRAYWRYTVLYQLSLKNEPSYDTRFTTALILAWIRAGYQPQNVLVRRASDGGWMGSQTGQTTDVFRAEEVASWMARGGGSFLSTEQGGPP